MLGKKTLLILRQYFKEYKPKEWLIEGEGGEQFADISIQNILRAAVQKVGLKNNNSSHIASQWSLSRFGGTTHLLENGIYIRYIQSLFGHSSSKTTEIYTHITPKGFEQIKNPLDKLDI